MSLAIDVDRVIGVLLKDGWHEVIEETFTIDAYEFLWQPEHGDRQLMMGGGSVEGVSATGALWKEPTGVWCACPVNQIIGVRIGQI